MRKIIILFLLIAKISGSYMEQNKYKVAKSAEDICLIKIGEFVPSAVITSIDNKIADLKTIINGKKSAIIFYRGGWCPFCNLQLNDLQNYENKIVNLGFQIIAISMDKPDNVSASIEKHNLKYELYSDSKANACKSFGIAFHVEYDYINKLKNYNMDIEKSSGENHHILPVPSVFVTDDKGKIVFEYVNPNYKERISGKLLLEAVKIYK